MVVESAERDDFQDAHWEIPSCSRLPGQPNIVKTIAVAAAGRRLPSVPRPFLSVVTRAIGEGFGGSSTPLLGLHCSPKHSSATAACVGPLAGGNADSRPLFLRLATDKCQLIACLDLACSVAVLVDMPSSNEHLDLRYY
jgi:hypothetical protein